MTFELIVRVVIEAFNCRRFERSVHSFDLTIGSRMFHLGQPMLNLMFVTDPIKGVFKGRGVTFAIGELVAIVGEHDVDPIRHCCNKVAQELRCG